MNDIYKILKISDYPDIKVRAAAWFSSKWHVPEEEYLESMEQCIKNSLHKKSLVPVPEWYLVMCGNSIAAGAGIIENDFHDRKDLSPNLCALYVEEAHRCRGIAGELLEFICKDMHDKGIDILYLITDHTSFYERYGWKYLCMAQPDGEDEKTRVYIKNYKKIKPTLF